MRTNSSMSGHSGGGRRSRGGRGQGGDRRHDSFHSSGGRNHSGERVRSATVLRNQSFDSNGPGVRVRGNAAQVCEKYKSLAVEAVKSGDRVLAENFWQYAEHYHRLVEAINEAVESEQRQRAAAAPEAVVAEIPAEAIVERQQPDAEIISRKSNIDATDSSVVVEDDKFVPDFIARRQA